MTIHDRLRDLSGALGLGRADGWQNPFTGFGTSRDKLSHTIFAPSLRLSDPELSALYHGDDMARKIVEIVPREMLRQGYRVTGPGSDQIQTTLTDLDATRQVLDGLLWGRLFGGALLILGVDDGLPADQPLALDRIVGRGVAYLQVYDRRRLTVERRNEDPASPDYQEPEVYRIQPIRGQSSTVHVSRTIRFSGAHTAQEEQEELDGWDLSVLQVCYPALQMFNTAHQAGTLMLSDASQAVFTMRGLISALAGGQKQDLMSRAVLLDMGRSVARAVMLDAEGGERYEKIATQFAGVPEMMDRAANRLAASSEIPVTLLMGQAPAGLNATGDTDLRIFYDRIKSDQANILAPILIQLVHVTALALGIRGEHGVIFPSLFQETPKERREADKLLADTDAIYLDREVLTPEEVRARRFGLAPSSTPPSPPPSP